MSVANTTTTVQGPGLELRELECFLILSEELHFGRTAERLYLSQGRVSQLLRRLEGRIGVRLLERSSRRVALTPPGERFLSELQPAYGALREAVGRAREEARGTAGVLRLGFIGSAPAPVFEITAAFRRRHPETDVRFVELKLSDPFGPLRRGEADAAFVAGPLEPEPWLVTGPVIERSPMRLVLPAEHPLAGRGPVPLTRLAELRVVNIADPAPRLWHQPLVPVVPESAGSCTLQEALSMVASDRGVMLLPEGCTGFHGRPDLASVPVDGGPDSELTLVWLRDGVDARLRAFAETAAELSVDVPAEAAVAR